MKIFLLLTQLAFLRMLIAIQQSGIGAKHLQTSQKKYYKCRNSIQLFLDKQFLETPCSSDTIKNIDPSRLYVFCIMFNDHSVLNDIISKFKSNTKDNAELWIIDNSGDRTCADKIQQIAVQSGIRYDRLPNNPHSGSYPLGRILHPLYVKLVQKKHKGSNSHGIAINWVSKNIVEPSAITYFGYIDHDIIPLHGINILDKLQNSPFYGRKQDINNLAYLWPGFCFFNRNLIHPSELNFLPFGGADTGSGNAPQFKANYHFSDFVGSTYRKEKILNGEDLQDHYIEYIDDWLHIINASNWKNSINHLKKMQAIANLKDQLL